ncbi:MAG: class I SAM-dependent methyltransferase [Thermoleophilia bacterium]|nr:class I SAM-dependent methyltransferase [Thermoleophilia bacterium]
MAPLQSALRSATRWAYGSRYSPTRRWRARRLEAFRRLVDPPAGARVVDLGGTPYMWDLFDHDFRVTLVNLPGTVRGEIPPGVEWVEGDACELDGVFRSGTFDLVFSNSVIEHVGDEDRQAAFAEQVHRLAPAHWIQTPSPRFPVEAHTGVPFYWQRSQHDRDRRLERWRRELPVWAEMIAETRVLSRHRMRALFPESGIWRERLAGLEKSITAYRPAR